MSDGYKTRTIRGPQIPLFKEPRKAQLPRRVVAEHQITVEQVSPQRNSHRWWCFTCNAGGDIGSKADAQDGAAAHAKANAK